jgi:glycosyltransferase involved in cell wall biosynthesis
VVSAATEPYGLTPVEAAHFGRPSIVIDDGGLRDSVVAGRTGARFADRSPGAIASAVREFSDASFTSGDLAALADAHTPATFIATLQRIVAEVAAT